MVGNGSEKYDHLSDGKQHSIGSCLGSFRNKDYETMISLRYVKKRLTVSLFRIRFSYDLVRLRLS